MPATRVLALALAALVILTWSEPGHAEVRFGRNVYIGGHDFSHQTYSRKRRLVVHLSDRKPRNEGCVSRSERGGRVKTCWLRRR